MDDINFESKYCCKDCQERIINHMKLLGYDWSSRYEIHSIQSCFNCGKQSVYKLNFLYNNNTNK